MLRNLNELQTYAIGATDGTIGQVSDVYFDDERWVVRYLVVETGAWLASRKVLISPFSVHQPDWEHKSLPVRLTREQVKHSPDIDTSKPVSRQYEQDYLGYYAYPSYWGGTGLWGDGYYPVPVLPYGAHENSERAEVGRAYVSAQTQMHRMDDPHLRSCREVIGYNIQASDGDIGHVEDMLFDEKTWALRYLVVNTSNWWAGHSVLIAPPWIKDVRWNTRTVHVNLSRQAIQDAPAFESTAALNLHGDASLQQHYGRHGYWSDEDQRESEIAALDRLPTGR